MAQFKIADLYNKTVESESTLSEASSNSDIVQVDKSGRSSAELEQAIDSTQFHGSSNDDSDEDRLVDNFIDTTCCCNFGPHHKPCSLQFSRELIMISHLNCKEMSRAEHDLC